MRFLLEPEGAPTLGALLAAARAARDHGLDGVLLSRSARCPTPLVAAAAVASTVDGILIAAEVALGDRHPLELAEEAAVVDVASGGPPVLVARPATGVPAASARRSTCCAPRSPRAPSVTPARTGGPRRACRRTSTTPETGRG